MYYLGIDAGGTGCRARMVNSEGEGVGEGRAGPANFNIGAKNVFLRVMDVANQAMAQAGLSPKDYDKVFAGLGIAGLGRHDAYEQLHAQPFPFQRTNCKSDAFIANIGAHGAGDGGIVIVGTGSIAFGRIGDETIRVGGYGFPISDEGSGAYIGLKAIRLTLRAVDGRISHSDLTRTLFARFDSNIVGWMDTATAKDYADFTPLVVQAAKVGDQHGDRILSHAAMHIELLIKSLRDFGVKRCTIFGGVSQSILPWLSPETQASLVKPKGDALSGAIWLAQQSTP